MSRFLNDFAAYIKENNMNVYHIAECKDGGAAEELSLQYANPCQDVYSVAKAFTVAAVGLMFDRGLLTPNTKICDVLKDECPEGMDERWRKMTVDMPLRHQVGLPAGFLDIDCYDANTFGNDYLKYMMSYPLDYTPGESAAYTDGAFYLLGRVVSKLAGEKMDELLWREMFYPLGVREAAFSRCPMGYPIAGSGLYIRAVDMVKLGEIFRQNGTFRGRRYLSEEWCRLVKEKPYEMGPVGIGALYGKGGMRGQMIVVDPNKNRSVAWTACMDDFGGLFKFIDEYKD